MIAELTGEVVFGDTNSIVLTVGGVGYKVNMPTRLVPLFARGAEAHVFTHQVVREDDISLYGFSTREERHLFSVLLTVSGIGPKAALALLSGFPIERLVAGITQGQVELITTAPGVGRKTAERLIVELREKVAKLFGAGIADAQGGWGLLDASMRDAVSALVTLGFSPKEAREAVGKVRGSGDGANVEEVVRGALKNLH